MVTAAELLSVAAFHDGREAQAFPSFGSERMGAPVMAFCRIDSRPIRTREPVIAPNAVVVQDSTLLHQVELFAGLAPDGYVLINSAQSWDELGLDDLATEERAGRLLTIPATALAREHLGRPVPNTCLLGALSALTGAVSIDAVADAVRGRFSGAVGEANVTAARAAYELIGSPSRA